ncbi:MAG: hypothetical protein GYB31_00630 [Bacteroidetes bacterium]|nr:hypothetical protein [Bacteroidota bacterium]
MIYKHLINLSVADFKLIFRDPSLRAFLVLPVILFALVIWFLPWLIGKYPFLEEYAPVFLMVCVIENTQMFSFISSMILIDEQESGISKMYRIVPLTGFQFVFSRLFIPYLFTFLLNVVLLGIQTLIPMGWIEIVLISGLTALIVPVYVLGINSIVKNRLEGMIWIKAFNMIVLVPLAAFFIPETLAPIFGVLPTYWVFQSIDVVAQQGTLWFPIVLGTAFFGLLALWLMGRFEKNYG